MPENNIFRNIEEQSQEADITLDLDKTLHAKKILWLNNFYEIATHKATLLIVIFVIAIISLVFRYIHVGCPDCKVIGKMAKDSEIFWSYVVTSVFSIFVERHFS